MDAEASAMPPVEKPSAENTGKDSTGKDKSFSATSQQAGFENIPTELKELPRWVMWKRSTRTSRDGTQKVTKEPYHPNGHKASSTDEATWSTYEDVIKALETGKFDGIGWMFKFPYVGFDQDHCREKDGSIQEAAKRNLDILHSYSEISPSGTGTHTIIKGTKPGKVCRHESYEMYDRARYFTMTGNIIPDYGTEINENSPGIKAVYEACLLNSQERERETAAKPDKVTNLADNEIISKASSAANGSKFNELYNGGLNGYPSPSEGDQALCDILAFYTKDRRQIERIFKSSSRGRGKTERPDYMSKTIEAALRRVPEQYGQQQQPRKEEVKQVQQDPAIAAKALEIMKNGDPINYILDVYNKMHAGDRAIGLAILCGTACQATITSNGLQPAINGPSGGGKSHAAISMVHLIPNEYKLVASVSAKALLYMDGLQAGTVIFVDDIVFSDELASVMKRSSTFYQKGMQHRTVDNRRNASTLNTPPRLMWLITSVDSDYGCEVLNRQLALDVVTTPEQQDKIIALQKANAKEGKSSTPEDDEVLICREIIRRVKSQLFRVKVPFIDRIEWRDKDGIRNLGIFIDLIGALAVLRFMQRKVVDDVIEAEEADFYDAKALYKTISVKQTTKLNDKEQKIAMMIYNSRGGTTWTEISERLKIPPGTLRTIIMGKDKKGGMMAKVPGLTIEKISELTGDEGQRRYKDILTLKKFEALGAFMDVVDLLSSESDVSGIEDQDAGA
jgi:putative DNA primase/helicase